MANIQKEKKDKSTFKLTCILTGKIVVINKAYYEKKIDEYGSAEVLHKHYLCKQAKSMGKRGYSIKEIQDLLGTNENFTNLTDEDFQKILQQKDADDFRFDNVETHDLHVTKPHVRNFITKLQHHHVDKH